MTDETTQDNTQTTDAQPENPGVNISIEQILAAVLNQVGPVTVPLDSLIANYGSKQIAINQNEDKSVVFTLVDVEQTSDDSQDTASAGE